MRKLTNLLVALSISATVSAQQKPTYLDSVYEEIKVELKTKEKPPFLAFVIGNQKRFGLDEYQIRSLLYAYVACCQLKEGRQEKEVDLAVDILSPEQREKLFDYLVSLQKIDGTALKSKE